MNVSVVGAVIFLYHMGMMDNLATPVFGLLVMGLLGLALYNPYIVFVLFVGTVPLEIIDVSPDTFDIILRPYQLLGAILFVAVIVRKIFGQAHSKFIEWNVFDTLIGIFVGLGFLSWFLVGDASLKQAIVVASFGFLYFVTRLFVKGRNDVLGLFPIFISSGLVVSLYGIIQNILYKTGANHLEVMPGRPNATFTEPDWFGVYIVFLIALTLAYLYYNTYHKHLWKFFDITLFGAAAIFFATLVITVARSAWVGVATVVLFYGAILFFQKKYKLFAKHVFWVFGTGLLGVIIVFAFGLTTFELGNRLQSTSSGFQEITVSCQCSGQTCLPTTTIIKDISELEQYGCRHIDLEDVESEEAIGNTIVKVYRKDPTVVVRAEVYDKTITYIKQKPLTGYGWGSAGALLGQDQNGTPLNASNIFLEAMLSVGLLGVGVLISFFLFIIIYALKTLKKSTSMKEKTIAIFALLGVSAIIAPNLFNAGLLLGFVWVFFGVVAMMKKL